MRKAALIAILACLVCVALAAPTLTCTAKLKRYPGYSGDIAVRGTVVVTEGPTSSDKIELGYNLSGIEINTSGGLHIHTGKSCASDAEVQGHHFVGRDPWFGPKSEGTPGVAVYAQSRPNWISKGSFRVNNGHSFDHNANHAIVLHDATGKIGCGVCVRHSDRRCIATISQYPGYTDTFPGGKVTVWARESREGTQLHVIYRLTGLTDAQPGGLHIHAGTSCADDGPHHWTPSTATDPWQITKYNAPAINFISTGNFVVGNGYTFNQNVNHAIVVHDGADRIGCGVCIAAPGSDSCTAFISQYPGHTDTFPSGRVVVIGLDDKKLRGHYFLNGLTNDQPGGLHIHEGTSCESADDVKGHYWNSAEVADPWDTKYNAPVADIVSTGNFEVNNGVALAKNMGHAIVAHDKDGTRIGCGVCR